MIAEINSRLQQYKYTIASLGLFPAVFNKLQMLRHRYIGGTKPFILINKYVKFSILCRPHTSDYKVFQQVFLDREYHGLDDARDGGLIIDCGANVGYTSIYFLNRFPKSHVIAVEPDPNNFSTLLTNIAPYKNRSQILHSAVWSHPIGLVLSETSLSRGMEWARTVREIRQGEEPALTAVDIGTLLKNSGFDRIRILKVDVEGAEAVIFSSNYETWIDKVDNLVIELHGEECRTIFEKVITKENFRVSQFGELTVCKRVR